MGDDPLIHRHAGPLGRECFSPRIVFALLGGPVSLSPGLSDAVATGDRKRGLEALRAVLASAIEQAKPHELAPLARQMSSVLEQLDMIPAAGEVTPLDDLAARRTARRGSAAEAQ